MKRLALIAAGLASLASLNVSAQIPATTAAPTFAKDVAPIMFAKCANCHEWFEGHGGNRVYEVQVCVMCHVPGMATSGRGIADSVMNPWNFTGDALKIVDWWGFDKTRPNAALALPVTTNNFKDLIHGIHAGRDRVSPFRDA